MWGCHRGSVLPASNGGIRWEARRQNQRAELVEAPSAETRRSDEHGGGRYMAAILYGIIRAPGNVERSKAEVLRRRADSESYSLLSMSRPFEQQVRELSDGSFQDSKCPGIPLLLPSAARHDQGAVCHGRSTPKSLQRPCQALRVQGARSRARRLCAEMMKMRSALLTPSRSSRRKLARGRSVRAGPGTLGTFPRKWLQPRPRLPACGQRVSQRPSHVRRPCRRSVRLLCLAPRVVQHAAPSC